VSPSAPRHGEGGGSPSSYERLTAAALSISAHLELPAVLRELVAAAVDLAEAGYGAIEVFAEDGRTLRELITVGLSDEQTADITEHPDSVAVPIRVGPDVFGRIYVADKVCGRQFSDEDEALVALIAAQAAVAVEYARRFDQERQRIRAMRRQVRVAEERSRLALDLHDGAVQRLFGVGMALQGAAAQMAGTSDPRVAAAVASAVDEIDSAINEIRAYVHGLRPAATLPPMSPSDQPI
jgi:signal transduction histidine kinase